MGYCPVPMEGSGTGDMTTCEPAGYSMLRASRLSWFQEDVGWRDRSRHGRERPRRYVLNNLCAEGQATGVFIIACDLRPSTQCVLQSPREPKRADLIAATEANPRPLSMAARIDSGFTPNSTTENTEARSAFSRGIGARKKRSICKAHA